MAGVLSLALFTGGAMAASAAPMPHGMQSLNPATGFRLLFSHRTATGACGAGSGVTYPDGRFTMCTETFTLAVPSWIPAGLTQRSHTYIAVPKTGYGAWIAATLPICSDGPGTAPCNPHIAFGRNQMSAGLAALYSEGVEAGWLVWAAPGNGPYVEIAERAMNPFVPLAKGTPLTVNSTPATISQSGGETVLDLTQADTRVTIHSDLARDDVLRIAQSLK